MEIEPIDSHRVRIALGEADLARLGIGYRDLITGSPALAPALRTLLELAGGATGFSAADRKLLIEVYPADGGGCTLYFSGLDAPSPPARLRPKRETLIPSLFRFRDADALVGACRAVYRQLSHRILRSTLYWQGGFVLSVCPLDLPPSRVCALLLEYADCVGHGRLLESLFHEHARIVREDDAIDAIASC